MKLPFTLLALCTVVACAGDGITNAPNEPAAPLPPGPGPLAWVLGMVIDDSGGCLEGATARVVRGQALDRTSDQKTPCAVWDYDGGFEFRDLVPGIPLTIRVTAPGYQSLDQEVTPALGPVTAVLFKPTRIAP